MKFFRGRSAHLALYALTAAVLVILALNLLLDLDLPVGNGARFWFKPD